MANSYFICSNCGYKSSKWLGRCPECSSWNSLIEEYESKDNVKKKLSSGSSPVPLNNIKTDTYERINTNISEFDRVLGGLIKGQTVFIGGEPGIGKSTLLLTIADNIANNKNINKIYFINGEESETQIKERASRLGINNSKIHLLNETEINSLETILAKEKPEMIIIDSIQTVYSSDINSPSGSISQIKETTSALVRIAKTLDIIMIIIGHIIKSGDFAGPKMIEHIVDTVISLEIDFKGFYRILRCRKNRFASINEIGIFIMNEKGLIGVKETDSIFRQIHEGEVSGISIYPLVEGNRIIPIEIQALVSRSQFNFPKRTTDGLDLNRLFMLVAIMEKKLKLSLNTYDIYLNITSGFDIKNPSADLAVIFAIYSSLKDIPYPEDIAITGEVGLTGEVRPSSETEKIIQDIGRHSFKRLIIPYQNTLKANNKIELIPVKNIEEAIKIAF